MRHEHALLPAQPYLLSIASRDTGVKGLGVSEGDEWMRLIMGESLEKEGRRRHIGIAARGDRAGEHGNGLQTIEYGWIPRADESETFSKY